MALRTHELSDEELFTSWQQRGDERARQQLVDRYLPLARSLARRYAGAREPFDDLLQVASVGLVKAINRFDSNRGLRFSSFAVPTILGELKRYFRDSGWAVHVPRGAQEQALELQQVQARLTARTGHAPTVNELAEYMELDTEEVVERLEAAAAHHTTSLDAPIDDDDHDPGTLADAFGSEDPGYERVEHAATISKAAEQLTARERLILELRFRQDMTQTEIAAQIGISQMQISRILRRTLQHLREQANPEQSQAERSASRRD